MRKAYRLNEFKKSFYDSVLKISAKKRAPTSAEETAIKRENILNEL